MSLWDILEFVEFQYYQTVGVQLHNGATIRPQAFMNVVLGDRGIVTIVPIAEKKHAGRKSPLSFAAGVLGPLYNPYASCVYSPAAVFRIFPGSDGGLAGHYTSVLQQHTACRHLKRCRPDTAGARLA